MQTYEKDSYFSLSTREKITLLSISLTPHNKAKQYNEAIY